MHSTSIHTWLFLVCVTHVDFKVRLQSVTVLLTRVSQAKYATRDICKTLSELHTS